ncbi:leucine-rich repeat domain-containing protein [Chloroflexota bacterium]
MDSLSDREYEVMLAIVSGKTIKQIAAEMFLSPKTVSTYHLRILDKLGMENDTELIRYGLENQLVQSETASLLNATREALPAEKSLAGAGIFSWIKQKRQLAGIFSAIVILSIIFGLTLPSLFQSKGVSFADPKLEAALIQALDIVEGPISIADLESILVLEVIERGISDLSGLEYCTKLRKLNLQGNAIIDIEPLAGLNQLQELYLDDNYVSDLSPIMGLNSLRRLDILNNDIVDVSPLTGLANLGWLDLEGNNISDISPLAGLINLQDLFLHGNNISDISPLAGLTNLDWLALEGNNISDISPLAGLTNLQTLSLAWNNISDISPLAGLTNLDWLALEGNNISDISPLAGLTNLYMINLGDNNISNISPLAVNSGLSSGDTLILGNNPLNAASVNEHIPQLQARGVEVIY